MNQGASVSNMFALGQDEGGNSWNWSCRLFMWEEKLIVECEILLNNVNLQVSSDDH